MWFRCDKARLRALLDREEGLRCLPAFAKDLLWKHATRCFAADSSNFGEDCDGDTIDHHTDAATPLFERLRFIERYIEPLARPENVHACESFTLLCGKAAHALDRDTWQGILGLPASARSGDMRDFHSYLYESATNRNQRPELRLISTAAWWAAFGCFIQSQDDVVILPHVTDNHAQLLMELAVAAEELGHLELGLDVADECLGLWKGTTEKTSGLRVMRWEQFIGLTPSVANALVLTLHELAVGMPDRQYRFSTRLYEDLFGIATNNIPTVELCRNNLQRILRHLTALGRPKNVCDELIMAILSGLTGGYMRLAMDPTYPDSAAWERASAVLEAALDVPEVAVSKAVDDDKSELAAVLETRLSGFSATIAARFVLGLGRAWRMTPAILLGEDARVARGGPAAVAIMETWLSISGRADYTIDVLRGHILNRLSDVNRNVAHGFVTVLSDYLLLHEGRGPSCASALCEAVLHPLSSPVLWDQFVRTYSTSESRASVLANCDSQDVSVDSADADLDAECEALSRLLRAAATSGDSRRVVLATMEVTNWLRISSEALSDANDARLRNSLRTSRIARCNPNSVAYLLSVLVGAAPWTGQDICTAARLAPRSCPQTGTPDALYHEDVLSTYRIVFNWLLLDLPDDAAVLRGDFSDVTELRQELRGNDRLRQLSPASAVGVLIAIVELASLTGTTDTLQNACMLLEAWLHEPIGRFSSDPRIRTLSPGNAVAFATTWMKHTDRQGPDFLELCNATVDYIRSVRDEQLAGWQQRREFVATIEPVGIILKKACLARVQSLRVSCRDSLEADTLERRMLEWLEQLEFRQLLESRFQSYAPAEVVEHKREAPSKDWPFLYADDWKRPDDDTETPLLHHRLGTLNGPSSEFRGCPSATGNRNQLLEKRRRDLLNRDDVATASLDKLVPQGCVWIRADFDSDGCLHWWAFYHPENGRPVGRRLHGGRSEAGALEELQSAVRVFDMANESAWANYQGFELRPKVRIPLLRMAKQYVGPGPRDRELLPTDILPGPPKELEDAGWHELAMAAQRLMGSKNARIIPARGRLAQREALAFYKLIESLGHPWSEPHGSRERDRRRKEELDAATNEFMKALQGSLVGFDELYEASVCRPGEPIDWSKTDVLLSASGPLFAAPLSLLPFGPAGKPLYEGVASVSSVVSLVLRAVAEAEAVDTPPASEQVLSAHFLKEDVWKNGARGLAHLHAELASLCRKRGWRIFGFGDDPKASVANVHGCLLAERDRGFRLAVIGGHGDVEKAGVSLSDAVWRGDGPLHQIDILVLCACAVGRLRQPAYSVRDAEGLCTQVVANGGRCVLAAKNPIADREAARFLARFAEEFLADERGGRFAAARALNRTRRALVTSDHDADSVSAHLAGSFELLGTT